MSESVVYAIAAEHMVKIGFTTNLDKRMRAIQTGCPFPIVCLGTAPGGQLLERALHRQFCRSRRHGEWFELTGVERTELLRRLSGQPYFIKLPRAGRRQMLPAEERERIRWEKIRQRNKKRAAQVPDLSAP